MDAMSATGAAASFGASSSGNKKAVHVKWAGKTIALGTFPANEADEKCARAKALTRAWRSTMRPKPTRDWVMMELERLGVRVVSGRLGRKAGEDDDENINHTSGGGGSSSSNNNNNNSKKSPGSNGVGGGMGGLGGWGDNDVGTLMAGTRRGSMGLSSMINDGRRGSLGSLVGLDSGDPSSMGRSMGNGFDLGGVERRSSGLGGIGGLASAGLGGMGMSVNPNQHYEMLKLHHMNLLNEIQETTLMMNLYQQQQLQQQQQQLQQQAHAEGLGGDSLSMSLLQSQQGGGMDQLFGGGGQMGQMSHQQRASLGLGSTNLMGNFSNASTQAAAALMQQQSHQLSSMQHQQSLLSSCGKDPDPSPSSQRLSAKKVKAESDPTDKSAVGATGANGTKNNKKRAAKEPPTGAANAAADTPPKKQVKITPTTTTSTDDEPLAKACTDAASEKAESTKIVVKKEAEDHAAAPATNDDSHNNNHLGVDDVPVEAEI